VLLDDAPQALAVLNTKKDALALMDALGDEDALHLSTLLCGAHRRAVLAEVQRRLHAGEPCRLISTQVVEAGVDLDFPLVLRALGPLSSIIQAAGRANREGKLATGRVVIFDPAEGGLPPGTYKRASQSTRSALHGGAPDMDNPETVRAYFAGLFQMEVTDREQIQKSRAALDYLETAQHFRMIDGDTVDVIVTYGSPEEQAAVQRTVAALRTGQANVREAMRSIQPFLVSLYHHQVKGYLQQGLITEVLPGLGEWHGGYDRVRGLVAEGPSAGDLVV
jgi:CRISPR-associated endonuclease/helicase Cas3